MDRQQLVRSVWAALQAGDLSPLQSMLTPDAEWRAVEDGPWNCHNRDQVVEVMGHNLAHGLAGDVEEVVDVGDERSIVAFRPANPQPGGWPLDNGIRYLVLTWAGPHVREMKGCADQDAALAYALARE